MRRRSLLWTAAAAVIALLLPACGSGPEAPAYEDETVMGEGIVFEIHRSAYCACCGEYEDYLRERGVEVREVVREDVVEVKEAYGIPQELYSCHTSIVGGYAVEGHVPLEVVIDLLETRPEVDVISLAGMPAGSPGMGGEKEGPWTIHEVRDGEIAVHTTW